MLPVAATSPSTTGLEGGVVNRAGGVSAGSVSGSTSSSSIVEFVEDRYRWRMSGAHAEDLRSRAIDWFALREGPGVVLVKRNSHRDVWRVSCGERSYFAKLYHPNDALARLKLLFRGPAAVREWDVGQYAAAHSIATVVPVATALKGYRGMGGSSLLITEAVENVEPLNDYWLRICEDRHRANLLSESLARLIARAHQCGFQHDDMHPGNILVRETGRRGEVLFVDLHSVRIGRSVSLREVYSNLAQLHQWFRRHSTLTRRWRFLENYIAYRHRFGQASSFARNFSFEPKRLVTRVATQAQRHAERLWSKRDRRTRRTGRYFARIRPAGGWRGHVLLRSKHPPATAQAAALCYTPQQWEAWLGSPLDWVEPGKGALVKDSHTATICKARLPVAGEASATVIVKRPLARNVWKRLGQAFGRSRNMHAWRMANMLLNRDLPVAQPLAVVERYVLGFVRVDSISLTDYLSGSVDLETFLTRDVASLGASEQRRVKDRLIASANDLLKTFHERGFVHRDFKAPNLLVNWAAPYDGFPSFALIDMDGIRHVRRVSDRQRCRAISRLCASLLASPACTRTDRLRFLKRCLGAGGRRAADWKALWRELQDRVCDKQNAKALRREWKLAHYGRE